MDNVRGQTSPYDEKHVEKARLTAAVTAVDGNTVTLRLEGETRAAAEGRWPVRGYRDARNATPQKRGFETRLLGKATYDLKAERFTRFDMVAIGQRWGGLRWKDEGGPIGFEFRIAPGRAMDRTPPYGLTWGELLANPYW